MQASSAACISLPSRTQPQSTSKKTLEDVHAVEMEKNIKNNNKRPVLVTHIWYALISLTLPQFMEMKFEGEKKIRKSKQKTEKLSRSRSAARIIHEMT